MRTTNLLRLGILASPTLALTYQVFIYVDYESRYGAKVTGKLYPNGERSDISFGDQGFTESCTNGTSFLTLNRTGAECRDLHTYAGIASVYIAPGDSHSRHLDISMPGYDLSCDMTATDPGVGDSEGVVSWVIGSGLYTFEPTANLHRVGVDCYNVSKEA